MTTTSTERMNAARIVSPGTVTMESVSKPLVGQGQVRLRIEGCGVCASNLGPWQGAPGVRYPLSPGEGGHEAWGTVESVGAGAEQWAIGTRVTGLTFRSFAEYDVADASELVAVPKALGDGPVPGEPLACAMNIFARSLIREGMVVGVVGIGFLGALLTRLAADCGACVIALSRRKRARDIALEMGATKAVALDDYGQAAAEVRDFTAGRLCDCVIEAVGLQAPLDLAAELCRERGRLIIAGYHQDGPRQVNMQLWNWRGLDVVNAHERDPKVYVRGMRAGLHAWAEGHLDVHRILTHRFPLASLDVALNAVRDRPGELIKAIVVM